MRVLVLGLGRMGSAIASLLASVGHEVRGYDPSPEARARASAAGVSTVGSPDPAGYGAVVAAVPLWLSAEVARELCPRIPGMYVDVSTLKVEVNAELRRCGGPLRVSVHPLFGRGAGGLAGWPIALTPIEDAERELRAASELFRGAELIVMDESTHDEAVAYSVALPHVLGYLFRAVSRDRPSIPTVSRRLQELAAAVEAEDPELTSHLISRSPQARRALEELRSALSEILSAPDPLAALSSMRGDWRERGALYEAAYRALGCSAPGP